MKNISSSRLRKIQIWTPGKTSYEFNSLDLKANPHPFIDLASNDYLGLTRHPELIEAAYSSIQTNGVGSGSSRLITGTRPIHSELEGSLAEWLGRDQVFLFPSGFQANIAAVIALSNRHTPVIADRLIHHSLLVGVQASGSKLERFAHNDLSDLERRLARSRKVNPQESPLVLTESLFSMEGTSPEVKTMVDICIKYEAKLLIDEAHALGIIGQEGKGLCFGLSDGISIISGTFGKAFGSGGAFLACNKETGERLLQSSGAFRYTTALAPPLTAAALAALQLIKANPVWGKELQNNSDTWRNHLQNHGWERPYGNGPIIPLLVGSDCKAIHLQKQLKEDGLLCIAIRPPTVPEGTSRLRIVIRRNLPDQTLQTFLTALSKK